MENYAQLKPTFKTCSDTEGVPVFTRLLVQNRREQKNHILLKNNIVVVFNNCIVCFACTLNETYNRPPYILATGSGNKTWWANIVRSIHKKTPFPNFSSYFISIGRPLLAQAQSEQRYPRFKNTHILLQYR